MPAFPENIIPAGYPGGGDASATGTYIPTEVIISGASNLLWGENPSYASSDFLAFYPQFDIVPELTIQLYMALANAAIREARYHAYWPLCMHLFIAHFLQIHLDASTPIGAPAAQVVEAGRARGLRTSTEVGDVSTNINFDPIVQSLGGWASWKLTMYGIQFATIAKIVGKGNMMVW